MIAKDLLSENLWLLEVSLNDLHFPKNGPVLALETRCHFTTVQISEGNWCCWGMPVCLGKQTLLDLIWITCSPSHSGDGMQCQTANSPSLFASHMVSGLTRLVEVWKRGLQPPLVKHEPRIQGKQPF